MASLIDPRTNQPFDKRLLTQELAAPSVTGVRQVWTYSIAAGLTPARLASLLQAAIQGSPNEYLTLAEELEERDPHYAAVLGVRKRALQSLPVVVEAASDDKADVDLADEIRELTRRPAFGYLVDDLLDALGKGYSVAEIMWQRGKRYEPVTYKHRDPRWFRWDQTHERLGLLSSSSFARPEELPAYKFICHVPRLKTGIPLRGGLARLVAFSWICKAYTLKDWVAFAEVFGMPLRLGRYGPNATEDDVDVLRAAVANIGSDAAAVLPETMKIEFQQVASQTSGHELFKELVEWVDRQISKAVLGQTMTTEAQSTGLGSNQADVHNDVRGDILAADARQLADTLNRDLVKPYIDLNYGPRDEYPRLELQIVEPEDIVGLVTALKELVPMGLKVGMSTIRDKLGLPDPEKDEELLAPPSGGSIPEDALNWRLPRGKTARNLRAAPDEIDALADELTDAWQEQLDPMIAPIERLARESADEAEFRRRLPELLAQMDAGELITRLARANFQSFGLGSATDDIEL